MLPSSGVIGLCPVGNTIAGHMVGLRVYGFRPYTCGLGVRVQGIGFGFGIWECRA